MHNIPFKKICAAGFVFYRPRWNGVEGSIWSADKPGNWKLHAKGFKSQAALKRAMDDLLKNDPKAVTE